MKTRNKIFYLISLVLPCAAFAMPHEECGDVKNNCAQCHSLTIQEAGSLLKGVGEVKSVRMAQVPGLFELSLENQGRRGIAYLNFGKKFLITGPIFDLATKKVISEQPNQSVKPMTIKADSVPTDNSIVIGNPEGRKKLFVFTDPECPYCAKLHGELVKLMYMDPDVAIFVKLFPLKMHPKAYDKSRVILGDQNPLYMLDKAFAGEPIPPAERKHPAKPVEDTIRLAESLGITATPTLVLPDGRILPGFREAAELKKLLSGGN